MKFCKFFLLSIAICTMTGNTVLAQTNPLTAKFQKAYALFEKDPQLKYASHSLHVVELTTGKVVFSKNSQLGLAPASTLKVVTAAAAFAHLGKDFVYQTELGFLPQTGQLILKGSGDPGFGSHRFKSTDPVQILQQIADSLAQKNISAINNSVVVWNKDAFDPQRIPDGWIMEDIGNYYGAGAGRFNWRENQYDILLNAGSRLNDPVEIVNRSELPSEVQEIRNQIKTAAKGTGDNAYIYLPIAGKEHLLKGTIPLGATQFSISGSVVNADSYFLNQLKKSVMERGINMDSAAIEITYKDIAEFTSVARFSSPALDSLSYWFLRKSINLYGEAFLKTIGEQQTGQWSSKQGLAVMKKFWATQGIDSFALRMEDGSGLSPQNRVTTQSLVQVLQYAKRQPWFSTYFEGFPLYNNMKMKSGTISGAKGFCGYHKAKNGKEYVFAIMVNNFSGSASSVVQKMYSVLNLLK